MLLIAALAAPVEVGAEARAGASMVSEASAVGTSGGGSLTLDLWAVTRPKPFLFSLHYGPRLAAATGVQTSALPFQNVSVLTETSLSRTQLRLSGNFGYGQQDFAPTAQAAAPVDGAPAPPPVDRPPGSRFVEVFTSTSNLTISQPIARGLTADLVSVFSTSAGLGHEGRALLPLVRTFNSNLGVSYILSLADRLSARGSFSYSRSSLGKEATSAEADAVWLHNFSKRTSMLLESGLAVVVNAGTASASESAVVTSKPLPTFRAALTQGISLLGRPLALTFDAKAQPAVDPLGSGSYLRASSGVGATWGPESWIGFSAYLSGARAMGGAVDGTWGASGQVGARVRVSREVSAAFGLQAALAPSVASNNQTTGAANVFQWGADATISWAIRSRL
jgi:hypothetical protein